MTVQRIATSDRETWLALRQEDVTASAVAALFRVHDFLTPYQLWALKTGRLEEDPEESEAMRRGRLLEPVAVQILREQHPDWKVTHNALPEQIYLRDPATRLGATPDVFVEVPGRGRGIVQVKSVQELIFRKKWRPDPFGPVEPPTWVAIQGETERHLAGADFAITAALVVGFGVELHEVEVPRVDGLVPAIEKAVAEFWAMVERGDEPPVDYAADADTIDSLYAAGGGEPIDLTSDNRIRALLQERTRVSRARKAAENEQKRIDTEIKEKLGNAEIAYIGGGEKVTWKTVSRKGYVVEPTTYRTLRCPEIEPDDLSPMSDDDQKEF
jgi:predicted phage-related endonuclease